MDSNDLFYKKHLEIFNKCDELANKSKCLSRHVGACLVKDGVILSTGFNRVPENTSNCKECRRHISGKNLDICKALHAEETCILNYLKTNKLNDLKDCVLYVSVAPCYNCAKLIVDCGIKQVYAKDDYDSAYTKDIFLEAGVKLTIFNI